MPVKRKWQEHPGILTLPCSRVQWSDSGSSCSASITQNLLLFQMVIPPIPHQTLAQLLVLLCSVLPRWKLIAAPFLIPVLTKPVLCSWLLPGQWPAARVCSTRAHPYIKQLSKGEDGLGLTREAGGLLSYITLIPAVLQVFYTSRPNSVVCIAMNIDLLKSRN